MDQSNENKIERKPDGTFKKGGPSANPTGRPQGSRNKATIATQKLLDDECESITRKAIEMALEGNIDAIKICLHYISATNKVMISDIIAKELVEE